jgi:uncharacterized protein (TIRG00374 family)
MSTAPVGPVDPPGGSEADDDEMPRMQVTRRNVGVAAFFIVSAVAFLYFGLPKIAGLEDTWNRIRDGNPWWLAAAALFTALSFGGYVVLFRSVFVRSGSRIGFRESYQITMAGLAATRLFAAGGAGGVALTAWALRRSGMERRAVADRTIAFLILTYLVYMAALVVFGVGLYVGLFPGNAPFSITVVPAIFGAVTIGLCLLLALTPPDLQRRLDGWARRRGRAGRIAQRLANLPAAMSAGVRDAIEHLRSRDPALIGAIAYWAFNIAVLWAAFRAFGSAPPIAVIVVAYFVGMLGNLLPLPGGVGGVDGGMIGALLAFGVDNGLAFVAVLTYRGFAFWLPTIPGAIAYFQLRHTVQRWKDERLAERERGRDRPGVRDRPLRDATLYKVKRP